MKIDVNNFSNMNLEELKKYQEYINERIGILEAEECIRKGEIYSKEKVREIVKECIT